MKISDNKWRDDIASPFIYAFRFFTVALFLLFFIPSTANAQTPLSGFNPATLAGAADGIFAEDHTFLANNVLPLQFIFIDNQSSEGFNVNRNNKVDIFWKVDTGVVYHGWRTAVFHRGEFFMKANRDMTEIFRLLKAKDDLRAGNIYNIDLEVNGFTGTGYEISKGIDLSSIINGLSIGATARYIRGEMIQEIDLTGSATATSTKTYDFNLFVDYVYDKNYLYERKDISSYDSVGKGYSYDLGLKYVFNKNYSTEILFRDLWGKIYWEDVPYTTAYAVSKVRDFDENGYMKFRPTIRGYEFFKDFEQEIPRKTDVVITYRKGPVVLIPSINFIEKRPLYWITAGYQVKNDLLINAAYNTNYRTFSAGISYKTSKLNVYANDFNLKRIKAIGVSLLLALNW